MHGRTRTILRTLKNPDITCPAPELNTDVIFISVLIRVYHIPMDRDRILRNLSGIGFSPSDSGPLPANMAYK